jgi:hypothetical protein
MKTAAFVLGRSPFPLPSDTALQRARRWHDRSPAMREPARRAEAFRPSPQAASREFARGLQLSPGSIPGQYMWTSSSSLQERGAGCCLLMQEVPLTDEERSVAEGDVEALNRYIEKQKSEPPPPVPSELYSLNSKSLSETGESLSELTEPLTGAEGQLASSVSRSFEATLILIGGPHALIRCAAVYSVSSRGLSGLSPPPTQVFTGGNFQVFPGFTTVGICPKSRASPQGHPTAVRSPWRTGPDVIRRRSTRKAEPTTMCRCTMFVSLIGLTLLFSVQGFSQSGTWTTKAPMPTARFNLAAGAVNGKLYAIGGTIGGNQIDLWHKRGLRPNNGYMDS